MNSRLHAHLHATPQQAEKLHQLQSEFAQVCNAISPLAQRTHCWNRVALHHMVYRQMREQFPNLGSQMVCNAIYAVSRTCRLVYQSPDSPFNIARVGVAGLPVVRFMPDSPVYFDRHTLSIKDGQASLFTLDGRMRFQIRLPQSDLDRLAAERLREIVLTCRGKNFILTFMLDPNAKAGASAADAARKRRTNDAAAPHPLPGYVQFVRTAPAAEPLAEVRQEPT